MTFNPLAAITLKEKMAAQNASVCELGNQRYTAEHIHPAESTRDFYNQIGFSKYVALDVNTEKDAIIVDLNKPYEPEEQYDLVTNIGTTEHVFNQGTCWETIHKLCKVGGYIYIQLPFTPWINHGFYNYNPIFFDQLGLANRYVVELFTIADRWGKQFAIPGEHLFKEKHPKMLQNYLLAFDHDVFCNVLFQKVYDEPFKMPFQGKYKKDIEAPELKKDYA